MSLRPVPVGASPVADPPVGVAPPGLTLLMNGPHLFLERAEFVSYSFTVEKRTFTAPGPNSPLLSHHLPPGASSAFSFATCRPPPRLRIPEGFVPR